MTLLDLLRRERQMFQTLRSYLELDALLHRGSVLRQL